MKLEDQLICPICKELFVDPCFLDCLHTLCNKHLPSLRQQNGKVSCPVCQGETQLTPERDIKQLPPNRLRSLDLELQQKNNQQPCEDCTTRAAKVHCIKCEVDLCEDCFRRIHGTPALRNHQKGPLKEKKKLFFCGQHKSKPLEFFCKLEQVALCSSCAITRHTGQGHTLVSLEDAVEETKKELASNIIPLNEKSKEFKKSIESAEQLLVELKKNTEASSARLKRVFDEISEAVRKRHVEAQESLRTLSTEKENVLAQQIAELKRPLQQIEICQSLVTEITSPSESCSVLSTKDAVTLEMKKMITRQADSLIQQPSSFEPKKSPLIQINDSIQSEIRNLLLRCGTCCDVENMLKGTPITGPFNQLPAYSLTFSSKSTNSNNGNLINNNYSNGIATNDGESGEWFKATFASPVKVKNVIVAGPTSMAWYRVETHVNEKAVLQYSNDDQMWVSVGTLSNVQDGRPCLVCLPNLTEARYWRIFAHGSVCLSSFFLLPELLFAKPFVGEVYTQTPDYSLSTSSIYSGLECKYENLVNSDFGSGVGTVYEPNAWIQATFEVAVSISRVVLSGPNTMLGSWNADHTNGRELQYSNNNQDWTKLGVVKDVQNGVACVITIQPAITAQYWRLHSLNYVATGCFFLLP
eukprot:TRINITY_DN616_c0_g1_i1.p1 TRINITY_DN616_c0_g1~~TRINITY_DN616_c0_g1_i1.p1  ORF type:complete len:639 (+),score=84.61 TRINITY_DN616_c0_g1_i1:42-1958(+)